jgi:hypothetical protein
MTALDPSGALISLARGSLRRTCCRGEQLAEAAARATACS